MKMGDDLQDRRPAQDGLFAVHKYGLHIIAARYIFFCGVIKNAKQKRLYTDKKSAYIMI